MNITIPMYEKGRSFLMAGGLVKAYSGHNFVYLHLLCQGFENIGKSLLLAKDYEKYGAELISKFHHDLEKLLYELQVIYGSDMFSKKAIEEIIHLNKFYKKQQLRYGDNNDFKVNEFELNADKFHKELVELLTEWNTFFKR